MNKPITVVAHKDLDGAVSTMCFDLSDEFEVEDVYFLAVNEVARFLTATAHELRGKTVYVLDLHLKVDELDFLAGLTDEWFVIDHHFASKETLAGRDNCIYQDRLPIDDLALVFEPSELEGLRPYEPIACSNICYNLLTYSDEGIKEKIRTIVQHARVVDAALYSRMSNRFSLNFMRLCDMYGVYTYYSRLHSIVLEDRTLFTNAEETFIRLYEQEFGDKLHDVLINGLKASLGSTSLFLFQCADDTSELAEYITKVYDIVIGIDTSTQRIVFRTRDESIHLGEMVRKLLNGGGHPQQAGVNITELQQNSWIHIFHLFANKEVS